jgi:flagellar biosynthesis chaperone FliJ
MTIAQRDAIPLPATGLMIFQTDGTSGFYYYDGAAWVMIGSGGASDWSLTGNAGTTPSSNFLGTTDDFPLAFRVNNVRSGYISNSPFLSDANTFFGYSAGSAFSTAWFNTGIGYGAMRSLSTGQANVAVGSQTLDALTSGGNNVAVGHRALFSNTTGSSNVAVGFFAMNSNTLGNNNIGIGEQALRSNSLGNNNIAVGREALFSSVNSDNIGIGYQTLLSLNSGNGNVGIGRETMRATTTSFNTAVGTYALLNNTSGTRNSAFGYEANRSNITGSDNITLGYRALFANSNGSNNFVAGSWAGNFFPQLDNSVIIGHEAAAVAGGSAASNNVIIGKGAAYNGAGEDNVLIGSQSVNPFSKGKRNVMIGKDAGGTETGDDKLYIANSNTSTPLIYGEFDNNLLRINGYMNVTDYISLTGTADLGEATIVDATGVIRSSDFRLKQNIRPVKNALAMLHELRGTFYEWKSSEKKDIGVIAQEVEKVLPEIVSETQNGFKAVRYEGLIPVLIEAVKEQQAQIETLKNELDALKAKENKYAELEKRLEAVEALLKINAGGAEKKKAEE